MVSLYSKLNQLPKFYVKLLLNLTECVKKDTFGELITRGQIYPEILQTLARQFQDLSFGQILDLGKIFSEIYTTFANLNQFFACGKGNFFFFSFFLNTIDSTIDSAYSILILSPFIFFSLHFYIESFFYIQRKNSHCFSVLIVKYLN